MKTAYLSWTTALLILSAFIFSCHGQSSTDAPVSGQKEHSAAPIKDSQIGEYIVELFEDSKGNVWIGTMSKGIARYDARLPEGVGMGKSLQYFTKESGLPGNTVVDMVEDKEGNLWFATHSGLSKYDGKTFTNFTTKNGLCDDRVANLLIDSKGIFWIGTWDRICQFDGKTFTEFPLPTPEVEVPSYQETARWVTGIMEDSQGNIWFSRSGYAVCKYDARLSDGVGPGFAFQHFTKADGLPSNCVQSMLEDSRGDIWFGSRVAEQDHPDPSQRSGAGGLSRYDGKEFEQFPYMTGLSENNVYAIYEDRSGTIWISATGTGLFRYDGLDFTLISETNRMDLTSRLGLQGFLEDSHGTLWLGYSGGLFRLDGSTIVNVSEAGPWPR